MKGLLLKDIYMAARYCKSFLLIAVVFLAVSCVGDENMFFMLYPVMLASILPVTLYSYDEREKWIVYSGTLPYSRAQLVSEKYLIGLIFEGVVMVLTLAVQAVRMMGNGEMDPGLLLDMGIAFLILGLISPSILLPFVFKYGAEKGRIAFYVVIGVLCAAGVIFSRMGVSYSLNLGTDWMLAVICAAAFGMYLLSWCISVVVYQKKEL